MADNPTVSNSYVSNNPDIPVRGTALTGTNAGKIVQHMRMDGGSGSTEAQVTGEPVGQVRTGLDIVAQTHYNYRGTLVVAAGSTTTVLNINSNGAKRGDMLRVQTGGVNVLGEYFVISSTTNTVTVNDAFPSSPVGLQLSLYRPVSPVTDFSGYTVVSIGSSATLTVEVSLKGLTLQDTLDINYGSINSFPSALLLDNFDLAVKAFFQNRTDGIVCLYIDGSTLTRRFQPGTVTEIGGYDLHLWSQSVGSGFAAIAYEGDVPTTGTFSVYWEYDSSI